MNLIFIYGPPASGKLTVAQELSKLTGYPIFHNHMTRDIVHGLFPKKLEENYELVNILRDDVLKYCTLNNISLIFTWVYDGPEDDEPLKRKVETVTENGGKILFVELTTPHNILLERVTNDSRKKHKKLTDPELLSHLLKSKAYSSIPYNSIFKVDTSTHTPKESAELITEHFNLIKIG